MHQPPRVPLEEGGHPGRGPPDEEDDEEGEAADVGAAAVLDGAVEGGVVAAAGAVFPAVVVLAVLLVVVKVLDLVVAGAHFLQPLQPFLGEIKSGQFLFLKLPSHGDWVEKSIIG